MSDIGIYSGNYRRVRDYAEAVDQLLLNLKGGVPVDECSAGPVVSLLEALHKDSGAAPSVQLLNLRLRQQSGNVKSRLGRMTAELLQRQVSEETIAGLETIANLLEQERVQLRAKLGEL